MANSSNTQISIANLALAHCGMNQVTSLSASSNDPKIKVINQFWAVARDDVFAEIDWSFATVTQMLTQIDDYEDAQWAYAYEFVTVNVANFWYVFEEGTASKKDEQKFEIKYDPNLADKVILSDLDDAIGLYTYIVTDVTLWSHKFVMAFSYRLASMILPLLTNDTEKALMLANIANNYVLEAKRIDSYNKEKIPLRPVSSYITARGA